MVRLSAWVLGYEAIKESCAVNNSKKRLDWLHCWFRKCWKLDGALYSYRKWVYWWGRFLSARGYLNKETFILDFFNEGKDILEAFIPYYNKAELKQQLKMSQEEDGDYKLKPLIDIGTGVAHDPEKKLLAEIIEKLNDVFGGDISDRDKLHVLNKTVDITLANEAAAAQVMNNTEDQAVLGVLPSIVENALLDGMAAYEKAITAILSTRAGQDAFSRMVYQQMRQRLQ